MHKPVHQQALELYPWACWEQDTLRTSLVSRLPHILPGIALHLLLLICSHMALHHPPP